MSSVPVVDVSPLRDGDDAVGVGRALDTACRDHGFFYVVGHGIPDTIVERVQRGARALFELPVAAKEAVSMERGGRAWRGWFPLGGELTAGRPDAKEGFYLGEDLPPGHPRVQAGTPLHGPNLIPAELPGLREAVTEYLRALTDLGHLLTRGLAIGLGLSADWFTRTVTGDPLVLLRFFRYPPAESGPPGPVAAETWGVGEHTDYGLLTILLQDDSGGLEVHTRDGWIDAPPVPGAFVCNLGDMLERMTGGRYRSTPHRVRNRTASGRLSIPFFFDPGWDAEVVPVPGLGDDPTPEARARWDRADVFAFDGTYGDYLLAKVGRVFPQLRDDVLD